MLEPNSITAVIPTRGDTNMLAIYSALLRHPAIATICVVVSDTPFNRYALARGAPTELIYTQDDDCVTDIGPLIAAWETLHAAAKQPRNLIVNAMTEAHQDQYQGAQTLIGFGTIFRKAALECFEGWVRDELFLRESDRVFATLNPHFSVFPTIDILPAASDGTRYWRQPEHIPSRMAMEKRIFEKTGIKPR